MAALMNSSAPASRSCFRSSFDSWLLSMLGILGILNNTIAIPPRLSNPIAVANDTPDMSAAAPSGFCAPQPFPIHKAPIEYPTNEEKKQGAENTARQFDVVADCLANGVPNGSKSPVYLSLPNL